MLPWLKLVRVKQWVKNGFVFFPIFFAGKFLDGFLVFQSVEAFLLFCVASSAVYVFNDLYDAPSDRNHPEKRYRPIANGAIGEPSAWTGYILLALLGLVFGFWWQMAIGYAVLCYLSINMLYTVWLKHISVVDVFIVASGFVVRLVVGAQAVQVILSEWIVIVTFLLALFLALSKRRSDLLMFLENGKETRKSLDGYTLEFLNVAMGMIASVCIVAYIMYVTSTETIARLHPSYLYATTIFVVLGIIRYLQLVLKSVYFSPIDVLYRDRVVQAAVALWLVSLSMIIY
jgi:4-hydroxybenzoate polyprenyltransferase